jgi:WD40 repeat protein
MPWRNYSKIPKDNFATTTTENFFNGTLSSNKSNGFNLKNQFGKTVPSFFPSIENKKKEKKKNEEKTPQKLRRELEKIKHEQTFTKINKKLTVVSTCFINEYDVLLISTTNNKICAWQYLNGEFKNVNGNRDFRIEKNYFKCSILSADSPQNSLSWDSVQKYLFTGQSDGKILKWDLSKPKNLDKEDLDFDKAHSKKEEELHKMSGYDREDAELEKKFFNKKKLVLLLKYLVRKI